MCDFGVIQFNALLDVGGVRSDAPICNLVWSIIFYSQKKTEDELANEDQVHLKWYWWDSNEVDGDWKWRKYNVMICNWMTEQFGAFLLTEERSKEIDFALCQEKLESDHQLSRKKKGRRDEEDEDEEKESELKSESKKISIDSYFEKNGKYRHCLVIEKGEAENNPLGIKLWHRISPSAGGLEYFREIRMEHKLFAVSPELIVPHYVPTPSPFSLIPQLNDVEE